MTTLTNIMNGPTQLSVDGEIIVGGLVEAVVLILEAGGLVELEAGGLVELEAGGLGI
jgi:hypothetical protein